MLENAYKLKVGREKCVRPVCRGGEATSLWQEEWQEAALSLWKSTSNLRGRAQRNSACAPASFGYFHIHHLSVFSKMTLGGGDQLCSYLMYGAVPALTQGHTAGGGFKACPSFHRRWQQVHKLTEESAINGHIVCVLRRTMTPGTHSFVCLLAVAQPASAPLNLKDTMGSSSLSIHIFGIMTKMNFHLSSRENKDPWISCRSWRWFPQL